MALAALPILGGTAQAALPCSGDPAAVQQLNITVAGTPTFGYYALPAGAPKGIVVVGHGYGGTALGQSSLISGIAQRDGVIAVAMDYRGQNDLTPTSSRGWRVKEGAEDSIAAAKQFEQDCGPLGPIVPFGISMGGNMTGLAAASHATRADGSPLFDYWFDVSGVTNPLEIYLDATAISLVPLGGIQQTGINGKAALEEEFGNPILSLSNYTDNSPLFLANQMKTSGIKGVVIAHGVLDGEVTSDQSVQMLTTLLLNGVPTDISAVVTKTPGTPSGLTLDGDLLGLVPGYESPFAGHVSQLVMNTALAKLDRLYQDGQAPTGNHATIVDGNAGSFPLL